MILAASPLWGRIPNVQFTSQEQRLKHVNLDPDQFFKLEALTNSIAKLKVVYRPLANDTTKIQPLSVASGEPVISRQPKAIR